MKRKPPAERRILADVIAEGMKGARPGEARAIGIVALLREIDRRSHAEVVQRAVQAQEAGKKGGNRTLWEDRENGKNLDERGRTPTDALRDLLKLTGAAQKRGIKRLAEQTNSKPASVERRLRRLLARDPVARRAAREALVAHREALMRERYAHAVPDKNRREIAAARRRRRREDGN